MRFQELFQLRMAHTAIEIHLLCGGHTAITGAVTGAAALNCHACSHLRSGGMAAVMDARAGVPAPGALILRRYSRSGMDADLYIALILRRRSRSGIDADLDLCSDDSYAPPHHGHADGAVGAPTQCKHLHTFSHVSKETLPPAPPS